MIIAIAEKDKEGTWWVHCRAFPNYVHKCKTHGEADRIKDALNVAFEMGRESKRQEIADAHEKLRSLIARRPVEKEDYSDGSEWGSS